MSYKILFRVDGGRIPGVSLGHVFRCIALARELEKNDRDDIAFLMRDYKEGVNVVRNAGFMVHAIDKKADTDQELKYIEQYCDCLVIFDIIDIKQKNISRLSAQGRISIVIDDTGNKKLRADVVINGSIVKLFRQYRRLRDNTKYYLGPKYCILGEDFDNFRRRSINSNVRDILIFMGGSDPLGLTIKVVSVLAKYPISAKINVVLGPASAIENKIVKICKYSHNKFQISKNIKSLAAAMMRSDMAITAGGISTYELAVTGTPGIIVPSTEFETISARCFQRHGAVVSIDQKIPNFNYQLIDMLNRIMFNYGKREGMSRCATKLVDGKGRVRVARIIRDLLTESRYF